MSEKEPLGYVVIQAGNVDRNVRVEPLYVEERVDLSGTEEAVGVLPAGDDR